MTVTDIAIVGVGKIARDQHIPALEASGAFRLAATASRSGGIDGVENFATVEELLAARPDIPALSLCMPPQVRFDAARAAIGAGRHVMLEKPPGATLAEVRELARLAAGRGVVLYATWHSRHADAVPAAKAFLAANPPSSVRIDWTEDVREWHPGQSWIWEPGGLGVFDTGINALSILTEILPEAVHLTRAELSFPENRAAPIAAALDFRGPHGLTVEALFDWRPAGPPCWEMRAETPGGALRLREGGAAMSIDGVAQDVSGPGEYPALYARFADLLASGAPDADDTPLVHVADAFMLGRRVVVEPFEE